ncbi:NAD(P)H nitroreductase [Paractinoplanes deccanensis]|uniref:NAD(P)H nitroreductase n=1 Tax=Paractinoplanes deccanensis TaxID=113561 RepID=A0ABQ3YEJ7_9ACTN|nr:nitroreductase [Actinoplanes deccanensis]GID78416.1 NAD(P)H nitroreductase [Actinoplanes deccanensis]
MSSTLDLTDPLARAAVFAGRAPSLHNSQPWHWRLRSGVLDLSLQPRRLLRVTDPAARLAVLSCGTALHHALIHLAADGCRAVVTRIPDPEDPYLLARVEPAGTAAPDHDAARLVRAEPRRRTDRRNDPGPPLDTHQVHTVQQAVRRHGAGLMVLRLGQMYAVAQAAELAQEIEAADPEWQVEIAGWVGGDRPSRTGVPTAALPADLNVLTAPAQALRRAGSVLLDESRGPASTFTVLHSARDGRRDWLTAGEALSAGWLTAAHLGVAVLPLSVVTEVAGGRDRIRQLLNWSAYPHLVLRLAAESSRPPGPPTPRLPSTEILSMG